MEENKKKFNWSIVAIIALACFMIFCLVKISDLSNEISNLQNTIANYQNQVNYLRNDINAIYDNVDEKLKKEASLLSSVDYTLGELNTDTHTIPVTLKVVPKSLTDDMQLSVKVGSETVALERNGNEFSATLAVNMFIDYDEYPMGECTIEIYHNNILFCEQTDDTREMKEVVLSADGDLSLYLVPADVADNLATVANEFAFNYVWHGEKSGKFLKLCGEQYGAVFDETDFIDYLNTVLYPDKLSKKLKTFKAADDEDVPEVYRKYPYYNF